MKTLKLILVRLLAVLGGFIAFYCGVGSLFILGDNNPKYHPMGFIFIGVAFMGVALFILGVKVSKLIAKG